MRSLIGQLAVYTTGAVIAIGIVPSGQWAWLRQSQWLSWGSRLSGSMRRPALRSSC